MFTDSFSDAFFRVADALNFVLRLLIIHKVAINYIHQQLMRGYVTSLQCCYFFLFVEFRGWNWCNFSTVVQFNIPNSLCCARWLVISKAAVTYQAYTPPWFRFCDLTTHLFVTFHRSHVQVKLYFVLLYISLRSICFQIFPVLYFFSLESLFKHLECIVWLFSHLECNIELYSNK